MKRVINGSFYNTQTAELLHNWSNRRYGNDFRNCEESLYKTNRGAYFIRGEGGAMSKYARSCGSNSMCGGDELRVVSEAEAMQWLEEHEGSDVLIEKFADKIKEA